jgi:uncharacterized membrane protein (UPF0127 family)
VGVLVVDGIEVGPVEVAATRRQRGRGLLGRDGLDGALWLPGVRSVHTIGMRFALDVAWIGIDGRVLRVAALPPGRVTRWLARAAGVVEAEDGRFERWGLRVGAVTRIVPSPGHGSTGA